MKSITIIDSREMWQIVILTADVAHDDDDGWANGNFWGRNEMNMNLDNRISVGKSDLWCV